MIEIAELAMMSWASRECSLQMVAKWPERRPQLVGEIYNHEVKWPEEMYVYALRAKEDFLESLQVYELVVSCAIRQVDVNLLSKDCPE